MFIVLVKGILLGFAIAAPVGPIGVLCIQRSLHQGFKIGLMTGLGAAIADGTYGLIVAFGLTALSSFLIHHELQIRFLGGLFLLYLGLKVFFTRAQDNLSDHSKISSWHAFGTSYLLTITNPATILSFLAILSSFGLNQTSSHDTQAVILVLGITLGSGFWWLLLSSAVAFILHHRLSASAIKNINRASGLIILSFGIYALFIF